MQGLRTTWIIISTDMGNENRLLNIPVPPVIVMAVGARGGSGDAIATGPQDDPREFNRSGFVRGR
jgi:hypothetical protein